MSDTVCGRIYKVVQTSDPHPPKTFRMMEVTVEDEKTGERIKKKVKKDRNTGHYRKPKPRFIVDGISHPKGEPIRFKSLEKAERHIKNFRMDLV